MSPLGVFIGVLNFQPSTFWVHSFVAGGLLLARSVCVIQPYSPGVGVCFISDAGLAFGAARRASRLTARAVVFFAPFVFGLVLVAMSSPFAKVDRQHRCRRLVVASSCMARAALSHSSERQLNSGRQDPIRLLQ